MFKPSTFDFNEDIRSYIVLLLVFFISIIIRRFYTSLKSISTTHGIRYHFEIISRAFVLSGKTKFVDVVRSAFEVHDFSHDLVEIEILVVAVQAKLGISKCIKLLK